MRKVSISKKVMDIFLKDLNLNKMPRFSHDFPYYFLTIKVDVVAKHIRSHAPMMKILSSLITASVMCQKEHETASSGEKNTGSPKPLTALMVVSTPLSNMSQNGNLPQFSG